MARNIRNLSMISCMIFPLSDDLWMNYLASLVTKTLSEPKVQFYKFMKRKFFEIN